MTLNQIIMQQDSVTIDNLYQQYDMASDTESKKRIMQNIAILENWILSTKIRY